MVLLLARDTVSPSTFTTPPVCPVVFPEASRVPEFSTTPLFPPSNKMVPFFSETELASIKPELLTTLANTAFFALADKITKPPSA
nr:hypothetical protein [Azospira inquinata]